MQSSMQSRMQQDVAQNAEQGAKQNTALKGQGAEQNAPQNAAPPLLTLRPVRAAGNRAPGPSTDHHIGPPEAVAGGALAVV